jgi:Tfp pilus assembly protein PilZ
MARRPKALTILSFVFLLLAGSMPLQIMVLYGHGFAEWSAVISKLTLFNWFVLTGLALNAALLWRVSPYLRYTMPVLMGAILVNNWIAGYYATDFSLWTTTLGTLAFSVLNIPLLDDHVLWVMQHPERRWWIRAERKRLSVPIFIEGARLNSLKAETFDLSQSGVFVPGTRDLGVGDWVFVRLQFDHLAQLRCQARVVRRNEAKGEYPAGIGIEFMDMSWRQKRDLRRRIRRCAPSPVASA